MDGRLPGLILFPPFLLGTPRPRPKAAAPESSGTAAFGVSGAPVTLCPAQPREDAARKRGIVNGPTGTDGSGAATVHRP